MKQFILSEEEQEQAIAVEESAVTELEPHPSSEELTSEPNPEPMQPALEPAPESSPEPAPEQATEQAPEPAPEEVSVTEPLEADSRAEEVQVESEVAPAVEAEVPEPTETPEPTTAESEPEPGPTPEPDEAIPPTDGNDQVINIHHYLPLSYFVCTLIQVNN